MSGIVFSGSGNANGKNILTFASPTCAEGGRVEQSKIAFYIHVTMCILGYGSKQSWKPERESKSESESESASTADV